MQLKGEILIIGISKHVSDNLAVREFTMVTKKTVHTLSTINYKCLTAVETF